MEQTHFLNGQFVSEAELLISPRDLGYSRGYAVFEFLVTYFHHKPFMLKKHIDRLYHSAELIGLPIPWTKETISHWVFETLEVNKSQEEKAIRVTISGGTADSLIPSSSPTISIIVDSVISFPNEHYESGVAAALVEFERYRPEAKTNNYIEAVDTMSRLQNEGVDEVIYYSNGLVREGSRSNIFAVINGKLLTPRSKILSGITREVLLEILKLDIEVLANDFSIDELRSASEVFLTTTGRNVVPITRIDNSPVGTGRVGSVATEAMKQLNSFISSNSWH